MPLWPACFVFFCPTPHIHLDSSYFCSWWVIGLLPAMWCLLCALDARMCVPARPCGVYYVPLLPRCVMLAGYAGMCPSDQPALFSFAQHHTCIWIPPISAAGEWSACCLPCGAGYVPLFPRCVMLAGYAGRLCQHVPLWPACLFSFALPHTCIWVPPISAAGEWPACCPQCGAGYVRWLPRWVLMAGRLCWHVSLWPACFVFSFAQPHTCIWIPPISAAGEWSACCLPCGACCVPSMRGCVFLPGHVVYTMCPCCPDVWCWPAMLACAPLTCLLCFLLPNTTHASGSRLILQDVSDRLAARHVLVVCPRCADVCSCPAMWCILCALVAQMCDAGRLCWHVPLWPACFVFFRPTPHMHLDPSWFCSPWVIGLLPAIWFLLCALDARMCVPASHVVYIMCPCCPDVWCWQAVLACAPLTSLHCVILPNTTHASGSLLFLQLVGDRLAACHVVLVVCPRCADVCSCPAMWCILNAFVAQMCVMLAGYPGMCPSDLPALFSFAQHHTCIWIPLDSAGCEWLPDCPPCAGYVPPIIPCVMLAGYAGMCPSDLPALFSFALPHTCIWIPPFSAVGELSACCPPFGAYYVPWLPRCVMLAGRLCWHVPLWPACFVFFRPTPHMHLDPSWFCSPWVIGLLPAIWCLLCALDARMCVPASHVVYIMCPCCPDVWCWQAVLACAPLTSLHCVILPNTTHASGSLLFLQLVGDRLAACHVVLVVCPRCADVCSCPAMWCILNAFVAQMCVMLAGYPGMCPSDLPALFSFAQHHTCIWIPLDSAGCEWLPDCPPCAGYVPPIIPCVMLAGYAGMCPSDLPALFSFALPHTCIWIPPFSAAGELSACCPPFGAYYVPWLPRCVMLAGRLCWHVPLWPACFVFFRPTPHMHLDPSWFCSEWVIGLLPAMWCLLCALDARMCVPARTCGAYYMPLLPRCVMLAGCAGMCPSD